MRETVREHDASLPDTTKPPESDWLSSNLVWTREQCVHQLSSSILQQQQKN